MKLSVARAHCTRNECRADFPIDLAHNAFGASVHPLADPLDRMPKKELQAIESPVVHVHTAHASQSAKRPLPIHIGRVERYTAFAQRSQSPPEK